MSHAEPVNAYFCSSSSMHGRYHVVEPIQVCCQTTPFAVRFPPSTHVFPIHSQSFSHSPSRQSFSPIPQSIHFPLFLRYGSARDCMYNIFPPRQNLIRACSSQMIVHGAVFFCRHWGHGRNTWMCGPIFILFVVLLCFFFAYSLWWYTNWIFRS